MKLYSIWWEEEILLMCSCNGCSKRGGKWKGETGGCLHLNSLKGIKALKAHFSAFCSSPALRNRFSSSELTLLQTQSLPLTLQAWNWCQQAGGVAALWFMDGECFSHPGGWVWSWKEAESCLSHSSTVNQIWKQGVYWPCRFPREEQRRTAVACSQIPKLTLAAARPLYDEDVSMFNKPVSQRECS